MIFRRKKGLPAENTSARMFALIMIHGAVLLAILLFCDVKYEVSDDFVMELIASGAFTGTPDAHLMFCSYLWGELLTVFYRLSSGISWYFWAQIAVCFLSCCAVSCYLAHTMRFSLSVLITVMIAAFFSRDMYLLPQFTKTAAVALASGGCLFVWSLFHGKGRGCTLGGAALVIAGCLIRHNGIFIVGIYLFLYVLYETVCLLRRQSSDVLKKTARIYAAGGILVFLIFALRWCNNMAYDCDAAYRYYMDYSYTRAYLVDYPLPDYSTCSRELTEIGISETDYQLICSWSFGDQNVFSLEQMQKVLSIVDQYRPEPFPTFRDVVLRFFGRGIYRYPGTCCCMLLAVIGFLMSRKRFVISASAGAATISLMLYFINKGHGVYRVEFGYLFAAALLLIFSMPYSIDFRTTGRCRLPSQFWEHPCLPWVLSLLIFCWQVQDYLPDQSYSELTDSEYREYIDGTFDFSWDYFSEKYTKTVNQRDIRPNFLQEVREHPENLYLLDFNTTIQSLYYEFSPFESLPKGSLSNMIYLGGVTVNHPVIREALAKWDVENELPSLLKENIYFVSNTTSELVLKYLQEHYDANATMTLYKVLDGYEIWSYHPSASLE